MIQPYGIRKVVGSINAEGDAYWPAAMRRTYFEQRELRKFIQARMDFKSVKLAVEFGCGYGRMLPILWEFAEDVIGIERDLELASISNGLYPRSDVRCVTSFSDIRPPIVDKSIGLILTYTVLQHLTDEECRQTIAQMKRILEPKGCIVICEDTGNVSGPDYYQRTLDKYFELFGMEMVSHVPRRFEDGRMVGQHMAFRWP